MPAPSPDLLAPGASTSSSGFEDGLGRRALAFDREEGTMLERLVLRPELAAFGTMLRERVERTAALEDERIARPRTIERDTDGALVVVSEFVPGSRLSDLLDTAVERGASPGIDAAFGLLLDVLPALCGLHAGAGFAHGTITPSRIVLTPAGQIVLLDAVYGGAVSHLRYSSQKLWTELGVATRSISGSPRLDVQADIAQVALAGVMVVLGRPLLDGEYPGALPGLLDEVVEVAQIRGGAAFATGLQTFLERALPLSGGLPFAAADDALYELRALAGEVGVDGCRRALVDFIDQMDPMGPGHAPPGIDLEEIALDEIELDGAASEIQAVGEAEPDARGDSASGDETEDSDGQAGSFEQNLDAAVEAELSLGGLDDEAPYDLELVSEAEFGTEEAVDEPLRPGRAAPTGGLSPLEDDAQQQPRVLGLDRPPSATVAEPVPIASRQDTDSPADEATAAATSGGADKPAVAVVAVHGEPARAAVVARHSDGPAPDPVEPADAIATAPTVRSRRAKRGRSSRARKDRLRSAASAGTPVLKTEAPAAPPQTAEPENTPWLVRPDRAAAFEPPVAESPGAPSGTVAAPPAAGVTSPRAIPIYSPVPTPPAIPSAPFTTASVPAPVPPAVAIAPPVAWTPPPVLQPPLSPPVLPRAAVLTPLKLKEPPPRPRAARTSLAADIYGTPAPPSERQQPSAFPYKLAAGALALMIVAVIGGRAYFPAGSTGNPSRAGVPAAAPTSREVVSPAAGGAAAASTGRLEIETQPAGARILLDGKPAGESPLVIDDVPAGRHVLTLVSTSGSVRRTVRVEAGRTLKLDVPIFSGWVGIFAPFVVEVSTGGRVIGTTEEPRLMLSSGKHELTLSNLELGYRSVQTVDIEPGEVRSITIDPRGTVNLNAAPWAGVWIDGQKVGDTPMANLQLPLGTRAVAFRHPELGERLVTITVKGNAPVAVSVDMTTPGP